MYYLRHDIGLNDTMEQAKFNTKIIQENIFQENSKYF